MPSGLPPMKWAPGQADIAIGTVLQEGAAASAKPCTVGDSWRYPQMLVAGCRSQFSTQAQMLPSSKKLSVHCTL